MSQLIRNAPSVRNNCAVEGAYKKTEPLQTLGIWKTLHATSHKQVLAAAVALFKLRPWATTLGRHDNAGNLRCKSNAQHGTFH